MPARKKRTTAPARKSASANGAMLAVGILGVLLALWIVYGTVTVSPFNWGVLGEELIAALCAVFTLRLLCVAKLPSWTAVACIILLPTGVVIYGAYQTASAGADFYRYLCIAGCAAASLFCARMLDNRPDGTLLTALFFAAALPALFGAETTLLMELSRLLLAAGLFAALAALRERAAWFMPLAAVLFGLAGTAGYHAAFFGAGAGIGALLIAPKKERGVWTLGAVLCAALPIAARLLAGRFLPAESALFAGNPAGVGAVGAFLLPHALRALAIGLLLYAARFFAAREGAGAAGVLALLGAACYRLLFRQSAPDVWLDAPTLACLAGVGVAKIARPRGRG